jgi:hypothetical protein
MTCAHKILDANATDGSVQVQNTDMNVDENICADAAALFLDHKRFRVVQLSGPIKIVVAVEANEGIGEHTSSGLDSEVPESHPPADAKHTTEADELSLLPVDERADTDHEDLAPNTDNTTLITPKVEKDMPVKESDHDNPDDTLSPL